MNTTAHEAVIWHDVECASYVADLPMWRTLADEAGRPVLELGCGTGRVTLDLARGGHAVSGVDNDAELISAARERGGESTAEFICADIETMNLAGDFALVIAPMQVLQLLADSEARTAALTSSAECMRPGGRFAAALVEDLPSAAMAGDGRTSAGVLPDVVERDGWVYSSLPLGVVPDGNSFLSRRLRQRVSPEGELTDIEHVDRLATLDAATIEREAEPAGLKPLARLATPTTTDHIGSTVVLLERAR